MIEASCHCGAVRIEITHVPEEVTECNCSICRRYGAIWAYYSPKDVQVTSAATDAYTWGQRQIDFRRCQRCGCVTHWLATDRTRNRMGVNARMIAPEILAKVRVRHLDGADTWQFLD